MSQPGPMLVTAHLASPLAGDPPHLDALLEWCMMFHLPRDHNIPYIGNGEKLTRATPAPPQGAIPLPLGRAWLGDWLVYQCSSPVMPEVEQETVDHVNKRIATEAAGLLREDERKIISTTNSWTKSYRLPLRVRRVPCVRWLCVGDGHEIRKLLRKEVVSIGKKVADGYGRIRCWSFENTPHDYSWFAPIPSGTLLMRPLPASIGPRPWLPADLLGYRKHFGAVTCPYWHPDRYTEIVVPC